MKLWACSLEQHLLFGTLVIVSVLSSTAEDSSDKECDLLNSRLVQKAIEATILPAYAKFNEQVPRGCLLDLDRSMYSALENSKNRDHPNKWTCYQCGKAFFDERFIDKHMASRHSHLKRTGPGVICLADLCEAFRCDVMSGQSKASYWGRALCNDDQLQHRRASCQELIEKCVPDSLKSEDKEELTEALNASLCRYLNCRDFWVLPNDQLNPLTTALYVMAFMVLSVGAFIYYYVAYTHFYTDDSIFDQLKSDDSRSSRHVTYPPVPGRSELRYRAGHR